MGNSIYQVLGDGVVLHQSQDLTSAVSAILMASKIFHIKFPCEKFYRFMDTYILNENNDTSQLEKKLRVLAVNLNRE